jgi:asparagine synthase (glutamine-hydrolysing)
MMLQYFFLIWDAHDPDAARSAAAISHECARLRSPSFFSLVGAPGLVVFCTADPTTASVQVLERSTGVVIGTLFHSVPISAAMRCESAILNGGDSKEVLASGGEALIGNFWGNYVAVLRDPHAFHTRVIRGPASTLPCFHATVRGVHLYFSSMELCARLKTGSYSIDWQHLLRSLLAPRTDSRTDIQGVTELLPGHTDLWAQGRSDHRVLWDPCLCSLKPALLDRGEAAKSLRAVARACIHAWQARHGRVLHALSGGLDSSIVLSCLSAQPLAPICLTQYADDAGSDERYFARTVAEFCGCELIEFRRDAAVDFRSAVHSVRSANSPGLRLPSVDRIELDLARDRGAAAVFRGDGGDELFCRNQLPLYLMDFARCQGLRGEFPQLLMHAAAAEGVTGWEILGRVLRDLTGKRRFRFMSLVTQDIERATLIKRELIHDLIASADEGSTPETHEEPPGRLWQASLVKASRTYSGPFTLDDDPEYVAPLLSQPVIELCMRIPTWFQMTGRRDRALARDAFARDLPPEILHRRGKGDAERLASSTVLANLGFLREMLLDGIVLRQGFLDARKLEAALETTPSADSVNSVPLFGLLGAEIWARAWEA